MISFSTLSFAQGPGPDAKNRDKIEAMKIAFITDKLDLSSDEAKVFWPVYNEFEGKMKLIFDTRRENHKKMRDGDLSDKELNEIAENRFQLDEQELLLKREYHTKFVEVLGIQKTMKLYHAEQQFKKELVRKMRDERGRDCLLYTSPSPRDLSTSRMPSSA